MPHRRVTLMIVPHGRQRSREISISHRSLKIAGLSAVALIVIGLSYAVGFHIRSNQHSQLVNLRMENEQLAERVRDMSGSVIALKSQMGELERRDEMYRVLANLPRVDDEIRLMGIGGLYDHTAPERMSPLSQAARLGMEVHGDVEHLLRQAHLQRQSFEALEQAFRDSVEFRNHLPSIWPVAPSQVYISSEFGYRVDPYSGRRRMHKGVDLAGRTGTPIMATADGIVRHTSDRRYIGKVVQIDHLYGYMTVYGHLSKILVAQGQQVSRGQIIAEMGNSGRSTGPHLHYSVLHNRRAIDPLDYFYVSQVASYP